MPPFPTPLARSPPPRAKRQSLSFTPASSLAVPSAASTSVALYPTPSGLQSGQSGGDGGISGLPSDVFVWIFVLIASGLVLLTAMYRVWRLRQLNRNLNTFFRPLAPPASGPLPPSTHPHHPDHAAFFPHPAYPPVALHHHRHTRVSGADIGQGGRRGDVDGKEELPPYERGTLPGYGEVTGWGPAGGEVEMARMEGREGR